MSAAHFEEVFMHDNTRVYFRGSIHAQGLSRLLAKCGPDRILDSDLSVWRCDCSGPNLGQHYI